MKNWLSFCAILAFAVLLSSCGINSSMVQTINQNQTSVVLQERNFVVIDQVSGKDSASYVLGFGGWTNRALTQSAYREMTNNAGLIGESRAIINITYETHRSMIGPLFMKKTVFVHGVVVEFTDDPDSFDMNSIGETSSQGASVARDGTSSPSNANLDLVSSNGVQIQLGMKVRHVNEGKITEGTVDKLANDTVRVTYVNSNGKTKTNYFWPSNLIVIQ
ncbi:MAG: DUF6567 family protein [Bacteroidota bacterium]